jgi:hypothetical protein
MKRKDLRVGMILECRLSHIVCATPISTERYSLITHISDTAFYYLASNDPNWFIPSELFARRDGFRGLKYYKLIR